MSTLTNKIFRGASHKLSSPFGKRASISTTAGVTSSFHSGADYSTGGKNLPQYAVAAGTVTSCGKASDGANFVWVEYPSLGVKMLHYHLASIAVKSGQAVAEGTLLGTTGKTGKATGVHLHLGIKKIGSNSWIDPEEWAKSFGSETTAEKYQTGNYIVTADVLNVRKGAGTSFATKKFSELAADAQQKILKLTGRKVNGYVKNLRCTVLEVQGSWGRTPSGWICLKYCREASSD